MEIQFINQNHLDYLKANVIPNLAMYKAEDSSWIVEQLGSNPLTTFKKPVEEFRLNPVDKEINNSRILYNATKTLTDSEATDERIWVGLTHGICWAFMRENMQYDLENNSRTRFNGISILNKYFFNMKSNARKRSIYINSLSKLWWAGRLCYNSDNKNNPFQYLSLFETAFSHKLINTFSSNYMANKDIRFSIFDTALYIQDKGTIIKGDTMVLLLMYLNELGGRVLLDMIPREQLTDMLISYADKHIEEITKR